MTATKSKLSDETQIRELIEAWAKAVRAKDINSLMANYAPDVVVFDAIPPLHYRGPDNYRKNWEECFSMFQGPLGYEIRDLTIEAGDGVAFCHSLNRISGTQTNGKKADMWLRATACFRKINGKWLVTHEHASVPFDPKTNQASMDLKP